MNKYNAKDYLPLVQALADGKTIQFNQCNAWIDAANNADFKWLENPDYYRIKPEPRTFEVWLSPSSGVMFPIAIFPNDQHDMERITVQEVLE